MRYKFRLLLIFSLITFIFLPIYSEAIKIASWNILNFPGSTGTSREDDFRKVIDQLNLDILVVQEMLSPDGVDQFLNTVMNYSSPGTYEAVPFFDGPDTDNALFYKKSVISFISHQQITIPQYNSSIPRDISEYVLEIKEGPGKGTRFRIYSLHLKAGSGPDDRNQREHEATTLRNHLNGLLPNTLFLVCGDFNMRSSGERAFEVLTENQVDNDGRTKDSINKLGYWHDNEEFADIHTQSTRTTQFGGGASGGLDDRFDLILSSYGFDESEELIYKLGSYIAYGNDGEHFNKAINEGVNGVVSDEVADALHEASDHLPVIIELVPPGVITHVLSITAGTGGTTNPPPGNYTYNYGTEVSITALPDTYFRFSHWSGDASGSNNPIVINMDSDKDIIANFTSISHTISTPNVPSGPSNGNVNTIYSYSTGGSTDSLGHSVQYRFYWGNGLYSSWSSSTSASRSWSSPGTYEVQAQARCATDHNIVSSWSSKKAITISKKWTTKRLTNNPANLTYPKIAGSGSYLHVAFLDGNTLAYKRSTNGGTSWGLRQNISTTGTLQNNPYAFAIAADGQYVHVVIARWSSSNWKIYYRRNFNYGASGSWGSWRELTSGSGNFLYPDIAVDGQYVHIVFQGNWPGNWEIFYKRISNYGVGSILTKRLTYSSAGASQCPRIATSFEYVYVLYQDDWPGNVQLFFKKLANYGAGSIITKRITHCALNSNHHDIAAHGHYIFLVFRNINSSTGNTDIFSKTIENWGEGSIMTKKLTYAACCDWPSLSFDLSTNEVQLAYTNDSPGNYEIFWKLIPNYGKGIYSTHRLTYSAGGTSQHPDILFQEGTTHIVYQDDWPGSKEIFYKRR